MDDADRISFLGARCPDNFQLHTLILQPGDAIDCHRADWADTLVLVERGELEIESSGGARAWFPEGAILIFAGLALRRLSNSSGEPLVLSALSRVPSAERPDVRHNDEWPPRGASHK
jgi:hypothetical protein